MKPFRASIAPIALVLAIAVALAGCGSSSDETGTETTAPSATEATETQPAKAPAGVRATACGAVGGGVEAVRVTGVGCADGRKVAASWASAENCTIPEGASRGSCRVQGRLCLSTVTDRGVAVTCAAPGKSVSFIARRR